MSRIQLAIRVDKRSRLYLPLIRYGLCSVVSMNLNEAVKLPISVDVLVGERMPCRNSDSRVAVCA